MNSLKDFSVVIYSDRDKRDMIAIEGHPREQTQGLRYISFYLYREEFESIVNGKSSSANDIAHNFRAMGDHWTFYDLDFSREASGIMQVPYLTVNVPKFIQQLILTVAKRIWAMYHKAFDTNPSEAQYLDRVKLEFSQATRDRWVRLYGFGKGKVVLDIDPQVQERFDEHMKNDQFQKRIEYLKQIALNSTIAFFETGTVKISKDWDGYYWRALNPHGQQRMVGGLVNHSREPGKFDWSIHT